MAEFKADAKEWKGLEHENIVRLSSSGFGPAPYIAMENVNGGDLNDLMKNHNFSMDEVINIIGQLLQGLSYAHNKEVIHKDLKPENILFDEKGIAKISDWCLDNFLISLNPKKILGNKRRLAYCAPEQLRPKEFGKPGKSTDVFRLGVIFYDEDPARIRSMITDEEPPPPSSLNPEVPPELDYIIMHALEKQKKIRWKSAEEMYEKLAELMKD
jgi:serine/threonine-protein kinase